MQSLSKHGKLGLAAASAGMDRKTAAKYVSLERMPSQLRVPRTWRTREDPFTEHWAALEEMLLKAPELEAKVLFEHLCETLAPGCYEEGQLRTLQRRVRDWRAQQGPEKEIFFPQVHAPGKQAQTDFTHGTQLGVTIAGEPFEHLICHVVLVYSNWEWVTVCRSESMLALRRGIQDAFFRLGYVPRTHQTDNSTAATHDVPSGKRAFNEDYLALMRHLGNMEPTTIKPGESQQNGDVESSHNAFKNRVSQYLILRGSKDFESIDAYESWLQDVATKANVRRQSKLREELTVMRPLQVKRLPDYVELESLVTSWSTIRVQQNTYSVPSRLIGEYVRVRLRERHVEVYHRDILQLEVERLQGRSHHRINYRHIIRSLVRKPGAFANYRYREDLFPALAFRRAYDALRAARTERKADIEYLRLLELAADTMEAEVETALQLLLDANEIPSADQVRELVAPEAPTVPLLEVPQVDLTPYDALLGQAAAEVAR